MGDTGLKSGWLRCRHGEGGALWGEAGWGGAGEEHHGTNAVLSLGNCISVCLNVSVFWSTSPLYNLPVQVNCTYFFAKYIPR